jgi:hypothetical protein
MPPQDAVTLDNWFPSPTTVDLAAGYTRNGVTGLSGAVESLLPYIVGDGGQALRGGRDSFLRRDERRGSRGWHSNGADQCALAVGQHGDAWRPVPAMP